MKIQYNKNPIILNDFLNYLFNIRNYSINTIQNYCLDILSFFKFLKSYFNINIPIKEFNITILSKVQQKDIIAFLVYLNFHKNNTGATRQRKLFSIRAFYKWLFNNYPNYNNYINPTKDIPNIEKVIRLPKYLTLEQSKKLITIFTLNNCRYPLRNNTIISLFLNTGLRLSELSNLNINDINFEDKYIKITGKGNKERKIFINDITKHGLLKYLKTRIKNKSNININEPLFVSQQNKRLGINGISNICKNAFKLMELEEYGYTPHTLRHTFATIIYQYVKPDVVLLKEYLGHNSIAVTQIYTHINKENLKKAVDNHPLNIYISKKAA